MRDTAVACALVALVVGVFAPVAGHEFVDWDDLSFIVNNPHVTGGVSPRGLLEALTVPFGTQWTPLSDASLQLNWALHGPDAGAFLLTNVALHAVASALLFLALTRMTGAAAASACVAAVFAVHPLHVESVAWAAERKGVLSGVFWMLSLLAYARFAKRPRSVRRYALVLLAFALALLAKAAAVTLPFVLLLLDYWPLRRFSRRALLEKLPMLALAVGVGAVTWCVQRAAGSMALGDTLSIGVRIANAVDSYGAYLLDFVWPSGLSAFYPHPGASLEAGSVIGAGLVLAGVSGGVAVAARAQPYLLVGWLWYLGTLLPMIGLVQVGIQARADRYTYLPLVGLTVMLAFGAAELARGRRALRVGVAATALLAIGALAVASRMQLRHWRDSEALWSRALAYAPDSALVHERLATLHIREGRLEPAERHYREAFRLDPDPQRRNLVRFELVMGDFLAEQGQRERALDRLRAAVALDPKYPRANALLGIALAASGRPAEALPYLERALASSDPSAILQESVASALADVGRSDDAIAHYRAALRLDPTFAPAARGLAWMLATARDPELRQPEEAVRLAEQVALHAAPADPEVFDTLAAAYASAGRLDAAEGAAERALALADERGASELAAEIRARLVLYRAGDPFVDAR